MSLSKLTKESLKEFRSRSKNLKPTVRIGKRGMTEEIIEEIKKQLKKNRIIKVKLLKSFEERTGSSFARAIEKKTNSVMINRTGFTLTFLRKN